MISDHRAQAPSTITPAASEALRLPPSASAPAAGVTPVDPTRPPATGRFPTCEGPAVPPCDLGSGTR
ncbi:hypothetical protein SSP24_28390 [Streptomyces spinoverrucosus]|uniref:Uncharacterized protein n=1 Tax=Streptomyces spinoverrucosus TaxID=284043 RepID=A0A4Y3VE78_9ACTN|nr:hypothetical protein SSP24_28390 [Streptomyces spinoverrucosus]GHB72449.1 hypothetical protein GCM10010397_48560 [Streptomyces spinoverrucosus]